MARPENILHETYHETSMVLVCRRLKLMPDPLNTPGLITRLIAGLTVELAVEWIVKSRFVKLPLQG